MNKEEAKKKIYSYIMTLQNENENCATEYFKLKDDETLLAYNKSTKELYNCLGFLYKFFGIFWEKENGKIKGVWNWGALE